MRRIYFLCLIIFSLLGTANHLSAQCDIQNKIYADGTMYHFVSPVVFYQNGDKKLQGSVVTDNENYFIVLAPEPFPERSKAVKLKDKSYLTLSNHQKYELEFYDVSYDTLLKLFYKINKDKVEDMLKYDAEQIAINMGTEEGERIYTFNLHKGIIREELICLRNRIH